MGGSCARPPTSGGTDGARCWCPVGPDSAAQWHSFLLLPASVQNSIAFGSAPRREAVSQLDRPAVSQTETHTLGFLSVADTEASSGENNWSHNWQWPSGNAVGRRLFGRRFEPWCGQYGSGATAGVHPPGFEPPT